jgi:hypothetical protein
MSINQAYIVNKINEIIRFSNETRHAMHIRFPDNTLVREIFNTGSGSTNGLIMPDIKQLTYVNPSDIITTRSGGKNRKKTTKKKPVKY